MLPFDSRRLLADIGSSCARLALETAPAVFSAQTSLRCADAHAAARHAGGGQ